MFFIRCSKCGSLVERKGFVREEEMVEREVLREAGVSKVEW